jgi:hypothetical protein
VQSSAQILYGVRSYQDRNGEERSQWTRIGAAFPCKDGSWNLVFDYIPNQLGTTINMRPTRAAEVQPEDKS